MSSSSFAGSGAFTSGALAFSAGFELATGAA